MKNLKKIKRVIILTAVMAFAAVLFTGCGQKKNNGKLSVVVTIFPEYDWVREILGDNPAGAEIKLLLDNGADLHSYQPTADDVLKVQNCDIFIYAGGESDKWVADVLRQKSNKDMIVLNLLDILGDRAKEEEIVEGMEAEEEEEEGEKDEHVWLSIKNAEIICDAINDALSKADKKNAETYAKNTASYKEKLDKLDKEFEAAVENAGTKTLLFGDRFPFRYLTDDYGLTYYAAFVGCSAESEASFKTIKFLADKINELSLKHVMKIESSNGKLADSIIENSGAKNVDVLTLNSIQSITSADVKQGASYLSLMEENLSVLKKALE
ncbi:MAG: zinc ABC transporter substrate-binding protein [Lachnospiraceae bacterium]|nr:zinc ABC transporter substrate-binding protein [Lachnospiraceae bacterium]